MAGTILTRLAERSKHICNQTFADKELILRSQDKIRFLRISKTAQIATVSAITLLATGWVGATSALFRQQAHNEQQQAAIAANARSVAGEARKISAYKQSIGQLSEELNDRQDALDEMVRSQFGNDMNAQPVIGAENPATAAAPTNAQHPTPPRPLSSANMPELEKLRGLEKRQTEFALALTRLIRQRAQTTEAAIRSFGLKPEQVMSHRNTSAMGGPYIPWQGADLADDDALNGLAQAIARLNALEQGLIAIPSGRPTASPMLTSSYGYRKDPFNGHAAFHAGVDFPGNHGQSILAAASGRVIYAGQKEGYGNVIDIEHGHGIMTRYAHLSGFGVHAGEQVVRGETIGRMGSTGRSTGTHLHFEVRVKDAPINPRRFLEARDEALRIQSAAKQRVSQTRAISRQMTSSAG